MTHRILLPHHGVAVATAVLLVFQKKEQRRTRNSIILSYFLNGIYYGNILSDFIRGDDIFSI